MVVNGSALGRFPTAQIFRELAVQLGTLVAAERRVNWGDTCEGSHVELRQAGGARGLPGDELVINNAS